MQRCQLHAWLRKKTRSLSYLLIELHPIKTDIWCTECMKPQILKLIVNSFTMFQWAYVLHTNPTQSYKHSMKVFAQNESKGEECTCQRITMKG